MKVASEGDADEGLRGWCARTACLLEARAPKPGNVYPGAEFPDLSHADLVAAATAIAPAMQRAPARPIGRTILEAVAATRLVTRSNANLGIILLMAPLAAVPDGVALEVGVGRIFEGSGSDDARDVYEAIRLARPGGLGSVERHDLSGPPPDSLLDSMRAAAGRDRIAWLWSCGFQGLFDTVVPLLNDGLRAPSRAGEAVESGIVRAFLEILARWPDTQIARRHGEAAAGAVSRRASEVLAAGDDWWRAAGALDRELRSPPRRNPGTTADLVAAGLFVLLRRGWRPPTP